ncbi:MAG: hypothetical protein PF961_00535 [Planctomycetota bacterium]|nr:hypothetical protein [Planctomycetota bacterium]
MWPDPAPLLDDYDAPRSRRELLTTLARIDGWGPGAWREIFDAWQLPGVIILIRDLSSAVAIDARSAINAEICLILEQGLPGPDSEQVAICDWLLRYAQAHLAAASELKLAGVTPSAAMRSTNGCFLAPATTDTAPRLHLRYQVRLPLAGMCIDAAPLRRFLSSCSRFAASLSKRCPGLLAHRRAWRLQQALRAQLDDHGLVAFVADGALLARTPDDQADPAARPLKAPAAWRVTLDCGALGQHRGLGIPRGSTALTGAPYHGKSTLLRAILAGTENHPPGDGREGVVTIHDAAPIREDEGRAISAVNLSAYYPRLPSGNARCFSTTTASGATSMAASTTEQLAAGTRLLLIDEDSAAGNFLHIDPALRRLIGPSAAAARTLSDGLAGLEAAGISVVLAVGATAALVSGCRQALILKHFAPQHLHKHHAPRGAASSIPQHTVHIAAERLLHHGHTVAVDCHEIERPRAAGEQVDLRRCGWPLDAARSRGAIIAAAWCARVANNADCDLSELRERYVQGCRHEARRLDPYDTQLFSLPPWGLVVATLMRVPTQMPR